jgi:hypothetical protein
MADFENEQQPTPQDLAALELYHQLCNLSPDDGDRVLMVTLRMPNGRYIGDVWLSQQDVETAVDKLIAVNIERADIEAGLAPAAPLPEVDPDEVAAMIASLQDLADGDL